MPRKNKDTPITKKTEIKTIIEEINIVPAHAHLPDFETVRKNNEAYPYRVEALEKTFYECFQAFKEDFKENLLNQTLKDTAQNYPELSNKFLKFITLSEALEGYYEPFRKKRENLRGIADFFEQIRADNCEFVSNSWLITKDGKKLELPVFNVSLVSDGTIGKIQNVFEAFIGADLDRIRACNRNRCSRIFWATDKREKYCSERCRNAKNSEDWYAIPKNRDEFLLNKKATYHANKPESEKEKKRRNERQQRNNLDFSK